MIFKNPVQYESVKYFIKCKESRLFFNCLFKRINVFKTEIFIIHYSKKKLKNTVRALQGCQLSL